ncbi:Vesicular inhibitory amino acid transporter [Nesidiocoris tenuis]|uniref:Vesicular inhibitory amino acid transporter n=1 Tax=Nesidiocoris tenuis TaxID=355587 RepID=A0ABN7ARI8_9HEMI|nr:Vesicular inhibitory amino acid transporter [Nesidiocoris tenuis]
MSYDMYEPLVTNVGPAGSPGLTLFFATCCIVDLFGVFPVIALPRAIVECGWMGIPLALVIFFIQIYTAIMLGRCWLISESISPEISSKRRYPYAAIAELAYGRNAGRYVNVLLGLTIFGGSVPNLLVAAQNLQLIGLKITEYSMDFPYCYWIIILGAVCCPIMWIGSPKDLKWLGFGSVFIVLTSSALTYYCLLSSPGPDVPFIPDFNWENLAIAYGILAFQFDVHPMILTVQMDMKNKNQLGIAILLAFIDDGTLFMITTVICYNLYGTEVHYNTLQGLPASTALHVDMVLVTLQIVLSTVVGASPLFQGLEDLFDISPGLSWQRCVLRTSVVIGIVAVGEVVPRFDLIMSLIGAVLMGQLMFLVPPVVYVKLRKMQMDFSLSSQPSPAPPRRFFGYGTVGLALRPEDSALLEYHGRADVADSHPRLPSGDGTRSPSRRRMSPGLPPVSRPHTTLDSISDLFRLDAWADRPIPLTVCEKSSCFLLVLSGLVATATSTYFAVLGTLEYANFAPPCIINVTLASRLIYDQL